MKNMRELGMIAGLIGGAICVFGGLLSILQGLSGQSGAIPGALFWALGFYFIGKGVFAAGISLNAADRTPPSVTSSPPERANNV